MANRPAPEIDITSDLVRNLLDEQAPDLAGLPLALLGRGWDNTNWRLGDELTVRLPHRRAAAELVANEQRWLPVLAPRLDLAVPEPVVSGTPSSVHPYPWQWTIARWIPGDEAATTAPADPAAAAAALGTFFRQLHVDDAPDDPPVNPYRGGPVAARRPHLVERLAILGQRIDRALALATFDAAAAAPTTEERVWLHGDLHTRNLLVDGGRLAAAIDWGDICTGDRAADLAATWMLAPDHVDVAMAGAGADDDAWTRARGWAVHFGVTYLALGDDDPVMTAIGARLLQALGIDAR